MKLFNSIRAWLAGQLVKGIVMTDENTTTDAAPVTANDLQAALFTPPAAPVADVQLTAPVEAAPVIEAAAPAVVEVPAVAQAAAAPAAVKLTELEKLEALIEKLELTTVKEVKAAISFIRALV
ncbi:hypothetical protein [Pseudomonas sp. MWU12-2345]|uniref:hypothetical protein n=1 Tax=Pseudomonas sp. MWU12-2345 TaxID=2928689 RepID=UPI00200C66F7|nr:hypothetical protein [Pseudomonas sp. MWU12-2345]